MYEDIERMLDQGRILPALELLKQERSKTTNSLQQMLLTYNIGAVNWDKLGNGLTAKNEFLVLANAYGTGRDPQAARVLRANALENLMLCASSFDEFDAFTAQLRALAPEMPVVSGLPPIIHEMRDLASPWSSALVYCAMMNYDRNDPSQDRGRYGVAKSTYHILLATRKQQRLSPEDWRLAIVEYSALSMRMTTDCLYLRGGDADAYPPDEFLPILKDSIPYVDEYLAVFTGDEAMLKVRDGMQRILNDLLRR